MSGSNGRRGETQQAEAPTDAAPLLHDGQVNRRQLVAYWSRRALALIAVAVGVWGYYADAKNNEVFALPQIITMIIGVLGLLSLVWDALRRFEKSEGRLAADIDIAMTQLRDLARRPPSLQGGLPLQPLDHLPVPWTLDIFAAYPRMARIPPEDSGQGLASLARYLVEPARNVVVTGPSGSGKTTLAGLTQLLSTKGDIDSFALRLHLGTWTPKDSQFADWACHQLKRDAARAGISMSAHPSVIAQALRQPRITLLLDGLDQLTQVERDIALEQIRRTPFGPVVLFSQPTWGNEGLNQAPLACDLISLEPVLRDDALNLLARVGRNQPQWATFLDALATPDGEVCLSLLRRPLFLSLVTYLMSSGQAPDPALMRQNATMDEIRDSLLLAEVDTKLGDAAFVAGHPETVERYRSWLRTVAKIQIRARRPDVVWWDLAGYIPWWLASILAAVVTFTLIGIGELFALFILRETDAGFQYIGIFNSSAVFAAYFVAIFISAKGDARHASSPTRWYRSGAARAGYTASVATWLLSFGTPAGAWERMMGAVVLGFMFFVIGLMLKSLKQQVFSSDSAMLARWREALGMLSNSSARSIPRHPGWSSSGRKWVVAGIIGGLYAFGGILMRTESPDAASAGLFITVLIGVGSFSLTTLLFASCLCFGRPADIDRGAKVSKSVGRNLLFGMVSACLWLTAFTMATISVALSVPQPSNTQGSSMPDAPLLVWVFFSILLLLIGCSIAGLIGGVFTLAGRSLVAFFWLALLRRLPWNVGAFLEVMLDNALLYRRGFAYSFRHEKIRDSLV